MALPKKPVRKKKPAFEGSGELTASQKFVDAVNKIKAAKIQGKDGQITLGGKKVATKTEWSLNQSVDASLFGDVNKTYLSFEEQPATTSGGGKPMSTAEADEYARDRLRTHIGDLQVDNHRLLQDNKRLMDAIEEMRDILKVAAERQGGEFIALASEIEATPDRVVIRFDEQGNGYATLIPDWVQMDENEGNLPKLDEPPPDPSTFTVGWNKSGLFTTNAPITATSGSYYKVTGTFPPSAYWDLSDKSQTK